MWSDRFAELLVRRRGWFLAGLVTVLAMAGLGASRLGFDFSPHNLFVSSEDDYTYLNKLHRIFGRDDNLLLLHLHSQAHLHSQTLLSPPSLAYLERLNRALAAVEGVTQVEDLTTLSALRPGAPAADGSGIDPSFGPLLRARLLSQDGTSTLVQVRISAERLKHDSLRAVVEGVLQAVAAAGETAPADLEVSVVGIPLIRVLLVQRLVRDQLTFLPMCVVLFSLVLWVIFRDSKGVLVPFAAVAVSLVLSAGVLGATGEKINIVNNVLPTLLFVIGVSDAIHLVARYRRELEAGKPRSRALRTTVRFLAVACLLTSVTTAVGFASLAVGKLAMVRQFGLYAAAGVLIAYGVTVILVPILLSVASPDLKPRSVRADRLAEDGSAWTADFALRRRWQVLGVGLALVVTALYFSTRVEVENFLLESVPPDDPVVEANRRIEADFGGIVPVTIAVEWEEGTDVLAPEVLGYVDGLATFLRSQKEVAGVFSVADLLREVRAWVGPSAPGSSVPPALPSTALEAAQLMALMEGALAAVGRSDLLTRLYSAEERTLRIAGQVDDVGSIALGEMAAAVEARLEADSERHGELGIRCRLSGDGPMATRAVDRMIRDMFKSILVAFVFILITMCVLLRSVPAGLVSMIPNLFPLLMTLGFMGALGLDLQVQTIIVFTVALGLAVDDTIHFMVRFQEEWRRLGASASRDGKLEALYDLALRRTFRGTGQAIFTTSVVLAVGYSVLLLSRFPITNRFGLGMLVTVVAALVGDLLLLPACLAVFRPLRVATRVKG